MVKNKGLVGFFLAKMWELIQITEKKKQKADHLHVDTSNIANLLFVFCFVQRRNILYKWESLS